MAVDLDNFRTRDAKTILIDGSGYIFRAFFGVRSLSTSDGHPTNATFGFINMLLGLLNSVDPEHIIVVFDTGAPTFRSKISSEYKANRPPAPPELIPQFADIHAAVDALGLPRIALEGYEADDIIGTYVRQAQKAAIGPVIVVSGDKDLLQLVGGDVYMWDTMKNVVYDRDRANEKMGVPPELIRDYLALVGDASDNIPGVSGVGKKTATALLNQYGSIEEIFANVSELSTRFRKRFLAEDALDAAMLSRKLATLCEEVPLDRNVTQLTRSSIDMDALLMLLDRLEFGRLIDRIPGLRLHAEQGAQAAVTPEEPPVQQAPSNSPAKTILTPDEPGAISAQIKSLGPTPIMVLCAGREDGPGGPHSLRSALLMSPDHLNPVELHVPDLTGAFGDAFWAALSDHTEGVLVQDAKAIQRMAFANKRAPVSVLFDVTLASYLIEPGAGRHRISDIMTRRGLDGGVGLEDPLADDLAGASARAELIQSLIPVLKEELKDANMSELLQETELPMATCLAKMELNGMPVNPGTLRRLSDELGTMAGALQTQVFEGAGTEFNINSPKQVAEVLFDQLGLEPVKKTAKSKSRSTDSSVLEALSSKHPVPELILQWRNVMKLKGTYADALPALVHPGTGRIHSTFHQDGTATGRLSSSAPNLQNIPVRSKLGARIRRAFQAPEGQGFLAVDYSQIDLRALAHLSADPALVSAFQAGQDIHTEAAALLYDVPPDAVTKDQRRNAKAINFGIIYGMGPHRLKGELGISYGEAKSLIDRYNERFVGVTEFFDRTLESAAQTGYVTTLLGRRRFLPVLKDAGRRSGRDPAVRSAERMARNTPVQGTSADILRVAMVQCDRILRDDFPRCKMVLQVHDELIFLGPIDNLKQLEVVVIEAMEGVVELMVPLVVHPSQGTVWSEI